MADSPETRCLTRQEVVLAALAPAGGSPHTPGQVQKLLFLLDENTGAALGGPWFHFEPYHYGPFDKGVYEVLGELAQDGWVDVVRGSGGWWDYRLTPAGQAAGEQVLARLDPRIAEYLRRASDFVRGLTFSELVSAIYKAYPQMRARGVFQG